MEPLVVVKGEVSGKALMGVTRPGIVVEIDFFVLHAAPQALSKDIIQGPSFTVHADLHFLGQEQRRILRAGEMAALVVIPNRRNSDRERPLRGREHKRQFPGFGQFPGHDIPRVPIDNGHQEQPTVHEPNRRHVNAPHMIRVRGGHPLEEIRIDLVHGMRCARMRPGGHPPNAHLPHIPLHPLAIDGMAFPL